MDIPVRMKIGLAIASAGLLVMVYEGFRVIDRSAAPSWLILLLAIAVPLSIGKAADRLWRRLR